MGRLEKFDDFTQSEKAQFQRVCRKLLKTTFIVREKNEEHRKDCNFIKRNSEILSEYFNIIGYDVIYDINAGVARLINLASAGEDGSIQSNRKKLKLWESVVLSALWLLYEDRMVNGSLTKSVIIQKSELDSQLEKFGARNKIDKGKMTAILDLLEKFNLIEVIGKVGESDCRIKLFTSMQFCLSESEFRKIAETTAQKMDFSKKNTADDSGFSASEEGESDE